MYINIPTIIDIEASGFGPDSYPIEIGVVRSDGVRYCKLIKPFENWTHWDLKAEALHGISRDLLQSKGVSGVQICLELNEFIGEHRTFSDGWVVDSPWLVQLYDRSQVQLGFRLSSLEMILKEAQYCIWDETKLTLRKKLNIQRHRASNDALVIQQTYMATLGKDAQ